MPDEEPLSERDRIAEIAYQRAVALAEIREIVAQQNTQIGGLITATQNLADAVRARPTRRETLNLTTIVAVITLLIVGGMFWRVIEDGDRRSKQIAQGNLVLDEIALLAERLNECTTQSTDPSDPHECFDAGQRRTAQAVGTINLTTIYIGACLSDGHTELAALKRCVAGHAARDATTTTTEDPSR